MPCYISKRYWLDLTLKIWKYKIQRSSTKFGGSATRVVKIDNDSSTTSILSRNFNCVTISKTKPVLP